MTDYAFSAEVTETLDRLREVFNSAKEELVKLPPSRMRAIAVTELESSFLRAALAVAGIDDPIKFE